MADFFDKVQNMDSDKLFEEIKSLNEKLFKMSENSPMRHQVMDMINVCNQRQSDLMAHQIEELDKTPDILDIGEIESVVYTPEYSEQDLLTTLSNFYTQKKIKKTLTKQPEQNVAPTVQQTTTQTPAPSPEFTLDVPKFGAKK